MHLVQVGRDARSGPRSAAASSCGSPRRSAGPAAGRRRVSSCRRISAIRSLPAPGLRVEPVADHLDRAVERDVLRDRPASACGRSSVVDGRRRTPAGRRTQRSVVPEALADGRVVRPVRGRGCARISLTSPMVDHSLPPSRASGRRCSIRGRPSRTALGPDADVPHPAEDHGAVAEAERARAARTRSTPATRRPASRPRVSAGSSRTPVCSASLWSGGKSVPWR